MGDCNPGLRRTDGFTVAREHTAAHLGTGDVDVLATPVILALAEKACVRAICDELPEGQTTVGNFAEIDHTRPTGIGAVVSAEAILVGHHGRRLEFTVTVRADDLVVATVRHRRMFVDRRNYLERLAASVAQPAAAEAVPV